MLRWKLTASRIAEKKCRLLVGIKSMRIARMTYVHKIWLRLMIGVLLTGVISAAPDELQGKYEKPRINPRLFGEELSMVGNERDEYASNLAAYAVKNLRDKKGDQKSLALAREILGLALHLSPRNKKSLIANAQLARGIMPQPVAGDYEPDVFARLLLTRGQLLEKRDGASNAMLARYLIELASRIDPRNEDAIYESELRRIDHGEISWKKLTDAKTVVSGATEEKSDSR